jgi:hypothetical protein
VKAYEDNHRHSPLVYSIGRLLADRITHAYFTAAGMVILTSFQNTGTYPKLDF